MSLAPLSRRQLLPLLAGMMIAVIAPAAATTPGFFTLGNGQAIIASMVFVGMVATGMTIGHGVGRLCLCSRWPPPAPSAP